MLQLLTDVFLPRSIHVPVHQCFWGMKVVSVTLTGTAVGLRAWCDPGQTDAGCFTVLPYWGCFKKIYWKRNSLLLSAYSPEGQHNEYSMLCSVIGWKSELFSDCAKDDISHWHVWSTVWAIPYEVILISHWRVTPTYCTFLSHIDDTVYCSVQLCFISHVHTTRTQDRAHVAQHNLSQPTWCNSGRHAMRHLKKTGRGRGPTITVPGAISPGHLLITNPSQSCLGSEVNT